MIRQKRIKVLWVSVGILGMAAGAMGQKSVLVTDSSDNELWFLDASKLGDGIAGNEVVKAVGLPGLPAEPSFTANYVKAAPDRSSVIVTAGAKSAVGDTVVAGHHKVDASGGIVFSNLDYVATPLVQMTSGGIDYNADGSLAAVGHDRNYLGVGVVNNTGANMGQVTTHMGGAMAYPRYPLFLSHGGDDYTLLGYQNVSSQADLYKVSGAGTGFVSTWDLDVANSPNAQRSTFGWARSPSVSDLAYGASFKSGEVYKLDASGFDGTTGSLHANTLIDFASSTNPLVGAHDGQGWTNIDGATSDITISADGSVMFVSNFSTRQIIALALDASGNLDLTEGPMSDGILASVTAPDRVEEILLVDNRLVAMSASNRTGNSLLIEVWDISDFLDGNLIGAGFSSPADNILKDLAYAGLTLSAPKDADWVIPEPASLVLMGLAVGVLLRRRAC